MDDVSEPEVTFELLDLEAQGHKGPAVSVDLHLKEGQIVTFALRIPPEKPPIPQAIPKLSTAKEYNVTLEGASACCSFFAATKRLASNY